MIPGRKILNYCSDTVNMQTGKQNGAFYMSVAFEEGRLNSRQTLPIDNQEVRKHVEGLVNQPGLMPDKRFVYYLMGATGIVAN